MSIAVRKAH